MRKSKWYKKVWPIVSEYIRRRDADGNGYVKCVTCDTVKHWQEMQAGHFIAQAQGNSTKWDERNIHAQCYRCNMNLGGNGAEYYPYMLERYGQEVVDELRRKSHQSLKLSDADWDELYDKYKKLLDEL